MSPTTNVTHQVPVELRVRDFTLPDLPSSKTMLALGYEDINQRYFGDPYRDTGSSNGELSRLVRDRHALVAHRHRISLIGSEVETDQPASEWIPRLDGSLFTAANGYDGPGVSMGNNIYSIGTYGNWDWQEEGQASMRRHSDSWVNWFEANSPQTEYFLYQIDESDDYPQIERWSQWINDNPGPGSRLLSLATIDMPVATAHTRSLDIAASGSDIGITSNWETAARHYLSTPGKRAYVYNGTRPASGSFAIEDDGVALRVVPWAQYKKGIDRWFYWECTYYKNFQAGAGETNVFQQAQTFGSADRFDPVLGETGWNYMNGDGVLFYPGTDRIYPQESYEVLGPFASLRLKHWRRGIQDVDYLTLAAAIAPGRVREIVTRMVPKVLWSDRKKAIGKIISYPSEADTNSLALLSLRRPVQRE